MKDEGMLYIQIAPYIKFGTMMLPGLVLQTNDANEDLFKHACWPFPPKVSIQFPSHSYKTCHRVPIKISLWSQSLVEPGLGPSG